MPYTPDTDDVAKFDFTEEIVYVSAAHDKNVQATALRRPMSHSGARALQQFVVFDHKDEVFHLDRVDLATLPTFSTSDVIFDAAGKHYTVTAWEQQTEESRLMVVARQSNPANTKLHYRFEDADGGVNNQIAFDEAGNVNAPLVGIDLPGETGPVGRAIDFDGGAATSLWIHRSGVYAPPGVSELEDLAPISLAMWLRPAALSGMLVDFVALQLYFNSSKITLQSHHATQDGIWEIDAAPTLSEWIHLAITFERNLAGADPDFYVDGAAAASTETQSSSGAFDSDAGLDKLVGNAVGFGDGYEGLLDDFRLYDRALSEQDVEALYLIGDLS